VLWTASGNVHIIIGRSDDARSFVRLSATGTVECNFGSDAVPGVTTAFTGAVVEENKLTHVVFDYNASTGNATATAGSLPPVVAAVPVEQSSFDRLYTKFGGTPKYLQGVLSNVEIYDSGALTRSYAINDNGNTLIDSVSAQNGTVINGNADDWGLFQQQDNGNYVGQSLIVPPWASTNQTLAVT